MEFTVLLRRLVTLPSAICKTFLINYRQDSIPLVSSILYPGSPGSQRRQPHLFPPSFYPFVLRRGRKFNSKLDRAFFQRAIICQLTRRMSRHLFRRIGLRCQPRTRIILEKLFTGNTAGRPPVHLGRPIMAPPLLATCKVILFWKIDVIGGRNDEGVTLWMTPPLKTVKPRFPEESSGV